MEDKQLRCAKCKNSKPVLSEGRKLPVCSLQRRLVWACLTGKDDRFVDRRKKKNAV